MDKLEGFEPGLIRRIHRTSTVYTVKKQVQKFLKRRILVVDIWVDLGIRLSKYNIHAILLRTA